MNVIAQADGIVGIDTVLISTTGVRLDTYRRGAYCEWLSARPTDEGFVTVANSIEELAAEVVRIDAAGRKPAQPDDGLPPGPWSDYGKVVADSKGSIVADTGECVHHIDAAYAIAAHIARCGSPAVRRLLAAFEVTDEPTGPRSRTIVITADGNTNTGFGHVESHDPICWLTPRAKP